MSKKNSLDHLSFTQIYAFICPYKYKKIYIEQSLNKNSLLMTTGRIVHNTIRMYSRECIKNKLESDFEIMSNCIDLALNEEKTTNEQSVEIREILLEFAEKSLDYEKILDYEKKFDINLNAGIMEGIIDRVDSYRDQNNNRVLRIIDYKTSYKNFTESDVDNSLQLRIYRWAALKELYKNYDIVILGLYNTRHNFCRYGKPKEISELQKEIENIENFLNKKWTEIKECKEYPAIKSSACNDYGGCPILLAGECPVYSKEEINKILKGNDIIEQIRTVRILKSQINETTSKLKQYFSTNNNIIVDGVEVGFTSNKSYEYLLSGLLLLDKKYDLKSGSLELSKTAVEKLLKKKFGKDYQKYVDEIEDYILETASNSFEI